MANTLTTKHQRMNIAREFISSVSANDNHYYMFVGHHDTNTAPSELYDNTRITLVDAYRDMIMGKQIHANNCQLMIRNIPYELNTVYDMYDDQDTDLEDKDFYVIVQDGSYYHTFKCLDNNNGVQSTAEPNFAHISGANTSLYQTADGYRWKYMYSIATSTANAYLSADFFPVTPNTAVVDSAVPGAIHIIQIANTGRGYDNYLSGTFNGTDIRIGGNSSLYQISSANASLVNGFYTGTLLYISAGSGIGDYRTVTDYFCNSTGNYITLASPLSTPQNGSEYQMYPEVLVTGDGFQTANAIARAMVNASASNSIFRIETLTPGANYQYATATPVANAVVAVQYPAILTPIHGPTKGHGYDPAVELYGHTVAVNVRLANSESNTILVDSNFQRIGILQKPMFANTVIDTANITGSFVVNEYVHGINPIRIGVGGVNTTNLNISLSNSDIWGTLADDTLLYLRASDDSAEQIITVNSHSNATHILLNHLPAFACTTTFIYLANSIASMVYIDGATDIRVTNVQGQVAQNTYLIGNTSHVSAYVDTIDRNGVTKDFNTFIQTSKYVLTGVSGTFEENETVSCGNSSGRLHSAVGNTVYVSNQVGVFTGTIMGDDSGATGVIANSYTGELVFGSGRVLYMENVDAVERSNATTESFKFYLEF